MKRIITSIALLAFFVACEPKSGDVEEQYTIGPTAVVVGDSLTKSGRTDLHYGLGHHFSVKIAGVAGATYGKMTGYAEDYAMEAPTVAVIALGTNDRQATWNLDDSLLSLNQIYDAYEGFSCTVGVTITTDSSREDLNVKARALNEAATSRADVMADWDAVDHEPGMTQADETHATAEGYRVRAEIIAAAAESCGETPHVSTTTTTTTTTIPEVTIPEGP